MKTFDLIRDIDDSGVSGTGKIAEACVFSNGRCVVAWVWAEKTGVQSIVIYDSLEDAVRIHGHEGHTRFLEVASEGDGWPLRHRPHINDILRKRFGPNCGPLKLTMHSDPFKIVEISDDPADT